MWWAADCSFAFGKALGATSGGSRPSQRVVAVRRVETGVCVLLWVCPACLCKHTPLLRWAFTWGGWVFLSTSAFTIAIYIYINSVYIIVCIWSF